MQNSYEEGPRSASEEASRGIIDHREEMSAVESALDVLSRAATMVQGQFTPRNTYLTRDLASVYAPPGSLVCVRSCWRPSVRHVPIPAASVLIDVGNRCICSTNAN